MSKNQESIMLVRREVRCLEQEQKTLKQRLNRMKFNQAPDYYQEHGKDRSRLNVIDEALEQKRGKLEKLLERQQLTLF